MKALVGVVALLLVLVGVSHLRNPAPPASPKIEAFDPQRAFDDGLRFEADWESAKANKRDAPPDPVRLDAIDRALGEIPLDWPKADEATALVRRLRAERPAIEKAFDAAMKSYSAKIVADEEVRRLQVRKNYAQKMETIFLDGGRDVYVSSEGKEFRTLRIKYVLMSCPTAHQISNNSKIVSGWRDAGFKKVILTDGYNATWTLDLN